MGTTTISMMMPSSDRYLRAGVFYVSNPNSHPATRANLPARVNSPRGVAAQLAGGGLTATGGHPISVVQRNIERGRWTNPIRFTRRLLDVIDSIEARVECHFECHRIGKFGNGWQSDEKPLKAAMLAKW